MFQGKCPRKLTRDMIAQNDAPAGFIRFWVVFVRILDETCGVICLVKFIERTGRGVGAL